jgi:hypothetical protein
VGQLDRFHPLPAAGDQKPVELFGGELLGQRPGLVREFVAGGDPARRAGRIAEPNQSEEQRLGKRLLLGH